jgi:diacylglycerol kinase family enzyme
LEKTVRRILFILNPLAAGGQGEITWNRFRSLWPEEIDPADVVTTAAPGHATQIAASASAYDVLASVGGDGTINEITNGIMDRDGSRPTLSIIPAGTGNDIARALGLFPFEKAFEALRRGEENSFDLMRFDAADSGSTLKKYSLLAGAVGFSISAGAMPWLKRVFGPASHST